jgi:sterol 3beta-glucosyltransferase
MKISIAAVGSRGDVQPYLALGLGLDRAGFTVQLCADPLYKELANSSGLNFTPVTAAPVNMLQQNLSKIGGPLKLMGWLERNFKPLARQFFADLEVATRQSDAILYSTLAFAGYHVAEKHDIRCMGVYNVPVTPTHAFQNPSFPASPGWFPFKGNYNWWSFRFANQLFFRLIKPIVNQCRVEVLGIPALPNHFYRRLDISPIPLLYGFSPTLLPRPDDWGEWIQMSGHWFMDASSGWQPPIELERFLESGSPPVYIGFGSMVDDQIPSATRIVLEALQLTGQRGILMGGWGGLGAGDLPENILRIGSTPHDWLLPRVSVVVHHGGAGTTATAIRAGRPNIVVPFFADQPFWGDRVYRLGAGSKPIPFSRLTAKKLSQAIDICIHDRSIREAAQALGGIITAEDGVGRAVRAITSFLRDTG